MTDSENKSLNEIYKAVTDFKSDIKDLIRDLKDDNRDLKEEIKELKNEIQDLSEIINDELNESTPDTIIDKVLALGESQPELASKLIDKFGDKILKLLDTFGQD
jgi:uncharacterized coiled-coil DUF342 family protein